MYLDVYYLPNLASLLSKNRLFYVFPILHMYSQMLLFVYSYKNFLLIYEKNFFLCIHIVHSYQLVYPV